MRFLVYALCIAIALMCAWLLLRAYARSGYNLLLWSGIFFIGQVVNGILVIVDIFVFPDVDLRIGRLIIVFISVLALLYGLIFMREEGQ